MSAELIEGYVIPENYPGGYKEKPWCPHTKLIEICTDLAGYETNPEKYCGESVFGFPVTSCIEVNKILKLQLNRVNEKDDTKQPDEEAITKYLSGKASLEEKSQTLEKYKEQLEKYNSRKNILRRWRQVVFDTCCATTSDEKNAHFRQMQKPEDLKEEEVVLKVKQFISSLEAVTGGYEEGVIRGDGGADNCNQSPRYHFVPS